MNESDTQNEFFEDISEAEAGARLLELLNEEIPNKRFLDVLGVVIMARRRLAVADLVGALGQLYIDLDKIRPVHPQLAQYIWSLRPWYLRQIEKRAREGS